jgi:hypothetical protein
MIRPPHQWAGDGEPERFVAVHLKEAALIFDIDPEWKV